MSCIAITDLGGRVQACLTVMDDGEPMLELRRRRDGKPHVVTIHGEEAVYNLLKLLTSMPWGEGVAKGVCDALVND